MVSPGLSADSRDQLRLACGTAVRSAADQIGRGLRGRDAALRLLLKRVQDVGGGFEPDRVDGPESVAVMARDDPHGACAESLQRFGVAVAASALGEIDREAHAVPHRIWKALQIRLARTHRLGTIGNSPWEGKAERADTSGYGEETDLSSPFNAATG